MRGENDGATVTGLEPEHYSSLTEQAIAAVEADAVGARFRAHACRHRPSLRALAPGEAIVFVAAAAPHRRAAFDAVDYVMDRLKTEAPSGSASSARMAPTGWKDSDHADRRRWETERR